MFWISVRPTRWPNIHEPKISNRKISHRNIRKATHNDNNNSSPYITIGNFLGHDQDYKFIYICPHCRSL